MGIIKGTTSTGFQFEVDPIIVQDMEWVDMIAEVEEKPYLVGKFIEKTIGKEQKKALYDHVRKDGHVLKDDVDRETGEIIEACGQQDEDVKNS